jgi:acetyltransferase
MASRIEPRTGTRPRRLRVTPAALPAVVRLRGGSTVVIRRIGTEDVQALQQFFRDLSPASRYRRFLRAIRELPDDMLARFTHPDPADEAVLVASPPHAWTRIIGMAQYAAAGDSSEIAVAVADAWQRQGLGYQLLESLLNVAADAGIERIHADVLADNHAMRQLAHKLGWEIAGHPVASFLVQMTRTLAHEEYDREPGFAPRLGTPNPQRMSPVMPSAR